MGASRCAVEALVKRLIALALLVAALGSCSKNPVKVTQPPASAYLVSSTPQAVLNNLIKSYTERDSTHYRECFDVGYVGQSYQGFDGDPPQPDTYSFDDEAAHISALQRSTTIFYVTLDLPNYAGAPVDTLAGDPPGWVTINIHYPRVQIDALFESAVIATGETFEFKFVPTIVSTDISPTGKLWKIIRWREMAP